MAISLKVRVRRGCLLLRKSALNCKIRKSMKRRSEAYSSTASIILWLYFLDELVVVISDEEAIQHSLAEPRRLSLL